MLKRDFKDKAQPLDVQINGRTVSAEVKEFSTGSVGWHLNTKVPVTLPDGTSATITASGNLVIAHSKELKADQPLGQKAQTQDEDQGEDSKPVLKKVG